jgi:hypothetical protein
MLYKKVAAPAKIDELLICAFDLKMKMKSVPSLYSFELLSFDMNKYITCMHVYGHKNLNTGMRSTQSYVTSDEIYTVNIPVFFSSSSSSDGLF